MKKNVEMSCFSTSFGYDSGSGVGGSKKTENEKSYDQALFSSIFFSFPRDISVVGLILDDSTNENLVQVIINHVFPATFEDFVESVLDIDHFFRLSDSGRQQSHI